ncbi:hypothetical protein OIDMADRAFT_118426 [Oidiodendron maius Zn]|uniref:Thioredoxin domain-containing protein n=1 Tax=Oidiodendron maius (strain Zn) TaxID=913774 RepID=A0A0C3HLV5_OIDMZ|nr:hypothetical protein OIDMADRAFT_118426 [Oidiodendron maius Zn]
MSKTVKINSPSHFNDVLKSSRIVVTDFYADWCEPCKAIAPVYEKLSMSLSRANHITFTKVDTDAQGEIASKYQITTLPTFVIFKQGKPIEKVGPDPRKLQEIVKKLSAEADGASGSGFGGSSSDSSWRGAELPKGYDDVTDQLEVKGLDLLNADSDFGGVRVLFDSSKPSGLQKDKSPEGQAKDWVESDTDEQLMLFLPFQSMLKVFSFQITSLPSASENDAPMRPKTIRLYSNRPHILGFEEADDIEPTQSITISAKDWDSTGTATINTRFVKFQSVSTLVMYFVEGDGEEDKVRVDRIRIIGEAGAKREVGKLEKIGDEHGE